MTESCTAHAYWHPVRHVRCLFSIGRGRDLPPPQQRDSAKGADW